MKIYLIKLFLLFNFNFSFNDFFLFQILLLPQQYFNLNLHLPLFIKDHITQLTNLKLVVLLQQQSPQKGFNQYFILCCADDEFHPNPTLFQIKPLHHHHNLLYCQHFLYFLINYFHSILCHCLYCFFLLLFFISNLFSLQFFLISSFLLNLNFIFFLLLLLQNLFIYLLQHFYYRHHPYHLPLSFFQCQQYSH